MFCAKCRTVTLERVPPRPGSTLLVEDLPYRCPRCEGLWVEPKGVLRLADQEAELDPPASETDEEVDRRTGTCPEGHGILGRTRVEVDEGFYLDRCGTCGGLWFDKGEWQRLARRELLHRIPDFWTQAWQRQQRGRRQREDYLDWIATEIGWDLKTRIDELVEILRDHPRRSAAIAYLIQESRIRIPGGK